MASAWGNSWSGAWGNSWGAIAPAPAPTPTPTPSSDEASYGDNGFGTWTPIVWPRLVIRDREELNDLSIYDYRLLSRETVRLRDIATAAIRSTATDSCWQHGVDAAAATWWRSVIAEDRMRRRDVGTLAIEVMLADKIKSRWRPRGRLGKWLELSAMVGPQAALLFMGDEE